MNVQETLEALLEKNRNHEKSTQPGINNHLQGNCTLRGLGEIVPVGTPGSIASVSGATVLPLLRQALSGHQGNVGAFTMHTVSRWTLDASISKRFWITESKAIQLRVDTTNIMKHPTPGDPIGLGGQAPGTNSFQDSFGQFTTKTGSRTFQGQARFTFLIWSDPVKGANV